MGMLSPPNRRCFLTTRKRATSFHRLMLRILAVLGAALCMLGTSAVGYAKTADVQTAWRLLDYMAVDYGGAVRSEEHTSELQSLMRISYAVFCLKKKK